MKQSRQQRKLLQSNTILQRTISEKGLMASDQQEKLLAQNCVKD